MDSSLVSGLGAIATFEQHRQRSLLGLDPSGGERLAPVGSHDHVTRLEVWRRVLEEAELVASCVVEAVAILTAAHGLR